MSVFYYLVCEEHRAVGPVLATLNFGGRWGAGDPQHEFLSRHWQCAEVRVRDEHDAESYADETEDPV